MGVFGCRDGRAGGVLCAHLGFVATFLAFVTPYWLKSDFRAYSAEFLRTGLWETCFRSHASPNDLDMKKYYVGCRWILTPEYNSLRDTIELPFFISCQVLYTFAFVAHAIASIGLISIYLCAEEKAEKKIVKFCIMLLTFACLCSTITVTVFGCNAHIEIWMPDPMHNYLSWSFALGIFGAFCELLAAICLQVDSRHIDDDDLKNENLHTFG